MSSTPSILFDLEDRLKTATIPRKNTVVFLMSRKIILGSCARTGDIIPRSASVRVVRIS